MVIFEIKKIQTIDYLFTTKTFTKLKCLYNLDFNFMENFTDSLMASARNALEFCLE